MEKNQTESVIGGACERSVLSGFFQGMLIGAAACSWGGPAGMLLGASYGSIAGALGGYANC